MSSLPHMRCNTSLTNIHVPQGSSPRDPCKAKGDFKSMKTF